MTQDTPGEESVDFTYELADRQITFSVSEDLYPLDAIYGTAYLFIDRCYVFLTRPMDHAVRARRL